MAKKLNWTFEGDVPLAMFNLNEINPEPIGNAKGDVVVMIGAGVNCVGVTVGVNAVGLNID